MKKILIAMLAVLLVASPVYAAFSVPYDDFQSGTVADPDQVDANFAAIIANMGTGDYTNDYYVTDGASLSENIDALDAQVRANADAIDSFSFIVTDFFSDTTDPVVNDQVSNWPVIKFSGDSDSAVWFTFANPKTGYDYKLKLDGFMDTANTVDSISMNIAYYVIASNGDMSPASTTGTGEDEIALDVTAEQRITHTGTNLKIPYSDFSETNQAILVKLWRDIDGVGSNADGEYFCLTRVTWVPVEN
jgi:hypothetical protein